jgi:hypothetical protein
MPERIRDLEAKLAMVQRHIAEARQIIARQHERIDALGRDGHSTAISEEMLAVFLTTLKAFEDHERQLFERADETVKTCCETTLWLDSSADLECFHPAQRAALALLEAVRRLPL